MMPAILVNDTLLDISEVYEMTDRKLDDINSIDIFKNLLTMLHERISELKEEVMFLRNDLSNKSSIISKLLSIATNSRSSKCLGEIVTPHTEEESKHDENLADSRDNSYVHPSIGNEHSTPMNNHYNYQCFPAYEEEQSQEVPSSVEEMITVVDEASEKYDEWHNLYDEIHEDGDISVQCDGIEKLEDLIPSIYDQPIDEQAVWRKGTTLIIGDSLLYGIDERKRRNTKVRIYPGAGVDDMFYNIFPLLRKRPENVIILAGTNNAMSEEPYVIVEKLMKLKNFIDSILPGCNVILSGLIDRYDDEKTQDTVRTVNDMLSNCGVRLINNSNILREHLGRKGLHMNPYGTGKLAINLIRVLKTLKGV